MVNAKLSEQIRKRCIIGHVVPEHVSKPFLAVRHAFLPHGPRDGPLRMSAWEATYVKSTLHAGQNKSPITAMSLSTGISDKIEVEMTILKG